MSSQQGKDTALAYLKVVIHLLNENMDELDFKLGRLLRLDDLNHLTSEQMLKIVTFLLRDVVGDKPLCKPTALNEFNKLGVGMASYDSGIDQIYHSVKQVFPEDSDLFNYSVLLLPSINPKRTKAVISYIMSFVLMCDNLDEQFSACFTEVIKENEEKVAICAEVDDLRDKITARIQEKEAAKQRLPTLQRELQNVEENIRKHQTVLAKLNSEMERLKTGYESKENKAKLLQQELERMNVELLSLEQQIVSNPNEVRLENLSVKKQLEAEMKCREQIGSELEKCGKECEIYESLVKRAHHAIRTFESVISLMEDTKLKLEYYTKTGNEMTTSSRKIVFQKEQLRKLTEKHQDKLAEVNKQNEEYNAKLKDILNDVDYTKKQIVGTITEIEITNKSMEHISDEVESINSEIEKLKGDIAAYIRNVKEVIPKQRKQLQAEAVEVSQRIAENFSHYPMLKMKLTKHDKSK